MNAGKGTLQFENSEFPKDFLSTPYLKVREVKEFHMMRDIIEILFTAEYYQWLLLHASSLLPPLRSYDKIVASHLKY